MYTYILISSPSCISFPPSLSHPSRWSQSTKLISLCYVASSHQLSILHLVVYICPCHSLTSSQLTLSPPRVLKFNNPESPWSDLMGDGSSTWHELEKRDLGELRQKCFSLCQLKQLKAQCSIPPETASFPRQNKTMTSSYTAGTWKAQ